MFKYVAYTAHRNRGHQHDQMEPTGGSCLIHAQSTIEPWCWTSKVLNISGTDKNRGISDKLQTRRIASEMN